MQAEEHATGLTARNEQLRQQIVKWKQTEKVLRERERRYRLLFELGIDGVEILDAQGRIVEFNSTYQQLVGASREEIIGQHTTVFASDKIKDAFTKRILPLLRAGGHVEGESELKCKDGSTKQVWRRFQTLYDGERKFAGIVVYNRDITERVQAVEQLRHLALAVEQNPIALVITDLEGTIEYVNFKFVELSGRDYEDVVGLNLREFKPVQQSLESYEAVWKAVISGQEWQGEFTNSRTNGHVSWESLALAPLFNVDGTITNIIVAKEDITSRKQAEAEALSSQRRLGGLATAYIDDLTQANERLQQEIEERRRVEEALRRSQARLQAQYKGIPVPTYSWQRAGGDFVLVDYNDAAEKSDRGNIAELVGKTVSNIFRDRPQVLADFARCYAEQTTVKREAPYQLLSTGETRYWVTTYNFVPPDLIIVHIQDITEHRQIETALRERQAQLEEMAAEHAAALVKAEERFKEVVNNIDERLREQYRGIPLPTYSWQRIGEEFVLVDFNDAAAKAMGRIVDFLGKAASEIFKDKQVLANLSRCFEEKRTIRYEAPYQLVTTGETRYFVTTYVFVPPNMVIDYIEDNTEYKQLEADLATCRQQLEEAKAKIAELTKTNGDPPQKVDQPEPEEQVDPEAEPEPDSSTAMQQASVKYKQAQELLQEYKVKLKVQHPGIPVPTYYWQWGEDDFVLVDYNQAAEKATRGSIADFLGKKVKDVFKDRPQVLADFSRCFTEKTIVKREAPYQLLTTGETRYFVTTYSFVPSDLIIVYIQDMTDYKRTQESLQLGEEHVELICRFSPEVALTFVNDTYCWYFKQKRETLMGQVMPFVLDEDREIVENHYASLTEKIPVGTIEYRVVKDNNTIRWQRWINRGIFDRRGNLIEIWSVGRDISRQREEA